MTLVVLATTVYSTFSRSSNVVLNQDINMASLSRLTFIS